MKITEYLVDTADQCAAIAKHGRALLQKLDEAVSAERDGSFLEVSAGGRELTEHLERICQSLLAKAVEIENDEAKIQSRSKSSH